MFNERTLKEKTRFSLDEELWKLIKRQFEVVNDELTSRGFITMHEAQVC